MKLTAYERARARVPKPIKQALRPLGRLFTNKLDSEMQYWRNRFRGEGGTLSSDHYRRLMLAMAEEADEGFLAGRVVADFGCGPRGSLAWLRESAANIGIDVLAARYADEFPDEIVSHGMIYVTSTERTIPMPSVSIDVIFTLNALDHCADLQAMCDEIDRVLKPGGDLIASFNLNEPPTASEPQCLTEDLLDRVLLDRFEARSIRFGVHQGDTYVEMFSGQSTYKPGKRGYMWFRGTKRPA